MSGTSGDAALGEALDAVGALAARLGIRRYEVCLAMGSLTEAEALAQRVAAGELSLGDARSFIDARTAPARS